MLPQFMAIVLLSAVASYAFQHTETTYQINGVCFYRYLAYGITVVLSYVCFSRFNKFLAIAFSCALSAVALSPLGHGAIEMFPTLVPFLAVFMGVTNILVFPRVQGRGFFELIAVLVSPSIVAESRIGGSFRLLATTESPGFYQLSIIAVIIVGGYFYLRYLTLADLGRLELLSNGGNESDVAGVTAGYNLATIIVVLGASATAAVLMITGLIVADALQAAAIVIPLYVLALALGAGIAIASLFYMFNLSFNESHQ